MSNRLQTKYTVEVEQFSRKTKTFQDEEKAVIYMNEMMTSYPFQRVWLDHNKDRVYAQRRYPRFRGHGGCGIESDPGTGKVKARFCKWNEVKEFRCRDTLCPFHKDCNVNWSDRS
ncbi:MAG: hypothetical protein ISN29_01985 [Gammaproteobacteria bacterium AqS3]|nr:hypothetical protein [Gammaproteobacteria bacterium AqS3]